MSAKDTEQRLIRVITEHYLEGGEGKLDIQTAAERAGISRQAFHRNYSHLKPYVIGKRPIEELLNGGVEDVSGLLAKCQIRIRELQLEIDRLRREHDKSVDKIRESYTTTLMNSDITLKNSDLIRETLEKQSLHNALLVKQKQELEIELAAAKAREVSLADKAKSPSGFNVEVIAIEPELAGAFRNYAAMKEQDAFEDEKEQAIERMLKTINKLCKTGNTTVILFVDRYLSNFSKYVETFSAKYPGKVVIVRTPLFNRTELKLFASKIAGAASVAINVPHCTSEAIIKAQRKFAFRDVPDIEFDAADRMMPFPTIQDGYDEVRIFQVQQGD